jgi:uncharacterized protein
MQPNVSTEVLRTLHVLHRQLTDLRHRQGRGPKRIHAHEANVAKQEAALHQLQADSKAFRVATDAKQLQFKTNENKIKELQTKLNQAASNKEYQLLKEHIAADEMANSVLADEILEAMERADGFHAEVVEMTTHVTKAKEELQRVRQDVTDHDPQLQAQIQELEAKLREAETALPVEIREAYARVVRQKGEDGLAAAEDGYCGGCNQHIPLNMYNAMQLNRPVFCRSCGRLLYIPEGHDPQRVLSSQPLA